MNRQNFIKNVLIILLLINQVFVIFYNRRLIEQSKTYLKMNSEDIKRFQIENSFVGKRSNVLLKSLMTKGYDFTRSKKYTILYISSIKYILITMQMLALSQ